MLGNDRIETASTAVTSIQRRNDIEKSTWRIHRYFVDFESWIHVEISTSNRRHNFHEEFWRRIDGGSTKICPLGSSSFCCDKFNISIFSYTFHSFLKNCIFDLLKSFSNHFLLCFLDQYSYQYMVLEKHFD